MTNKQLRDIAAYYGSPVRQDNGFAHVVDGTFLDSVSNLLIRKFKLLLRPMSNLTPAEIMECAGLCGCHNETIQPDYGNKIKVGVLRLDFDNSRLYGEGTGYYGGTEDYNIYEMPAILAYLQSIGVYVDGLIDPEFVELTPIEHPKPDDDE